MLLRMVGCLLVIFLVPELVLATSPKVTVVAKKVEVEKKRQPQQAPDVGSESDEDPIAAAEGSNCRITVLMLRQSGMQEVSQFFSTTKNKAECEKRAKPHRPNLYPDQVKKKTVSVQFLETP